MIKRRKKLNKQDNTNPSTIEELIQKYNFDLMWDKIEKLEEKMKEQK